VSQVEPGRGLHATAVLQSPIAILPAALFLAWRLPTVQREAAQRPTGHVLKALLSTT